MGAVMSAEQEQIKGTARQFLQREMPLDEIVARVDGGLAYAEAWQKLASELGAQALCVPEQAGGIGGSFTDLAMVIEESGRVLAPMPIHMAGTVAVLLRRHAGDPVIRGYLEGIAEGTMVMAVDVPTAIGPSGAFTAEYTGGRRWLVTGRTRPLVGAEAATHLLTWIESVGTVVIDLSQGATLETREGADPTRGLAVVECRGAVASALAAFDPVSSRRLALDLTRVGIALDSVGGARRCLELAVDYAKVREQFGRPIGSFQAIKHKCAEMLLLVEAATSTTRVAAAAADNGDLEELTLAADLAYTYAAAAYGEVASETIQILGGIGFTWEHPAHLYFKRAKVNAVLAGSAVQVRGETAVALGILQSTH
jgi:alkylation response protein AidB-like acyl-CoA dehydrogenase